VATVVTNGRLKKTFSKSFFERETIQVARELLGTLLCRRLDDGTILSGTIIEVEAYTHDDPACHAFRGKTKRCEVMFGPGGFAYVYFIYGMYFCLNVVTEVDGVPGAVLIRAIDIPGGNGPGKLCRQWAIDRTHNGVSLMDSQSPIWLAKGQPLSDDEVEVTKRIGLSVAQEQLWRFTAKGHPGVSGLRKNAVSKKTNAKVNANATADAVNLNTKDSANKNSARQRALKTRIDRLKLKKSKT